MQKQLEGTQKLLTSSVDRVAHIDGQLMQLLHNTHMLPAEYKCLQSTKTEQSIYECLLGFCFNNIFCAATNFAASTSFLSAQFQKRRNDGDGFLWCYCCRFVLNSKRLLSTSCNKQGHAEASSSDFFMVLFLMLLQFAESYV